MVGSQAHGLQYGFQGGETGHDDHQFLLLPPAQFLDKGHSGDIGQHQIGEDDLKFLIAEFFQGGSAVGSHGDPVGKTCQFPFQHFPDGGFIIYDKYLQWFHDLSRNSNKRERFPLARKNFPTSPDGSLA